jgi:hypothetical protein
MLCGVPPFDLARGISAYFAAICGRSEISTAKYKLIRVEPLTNLQPAMERLVSPISNSVRKQLLPGIILKI